MNISHPMIFTLQTPLKALGYWLLTTPKNKRAEDPKLLPSHWPNAAATNATRVQTHRGQPVRPAACLPLRVVHLKEAGQNPFQVGRMRISGRMADVCAELDRLSSLSFN